MTFNIPEQFKNLPVARNLDKYNADNFMLVADTGSGKTMLVPAYLHSKTGRKILMRQPTRVATRSAYEGLKEFWGPLGFHIGMMTSEDTIGTIDDNDITVVTDGEMTHILRQPKYKFTCIFDEIHSQMAATEIELAIVKTYMNKGMDIRVVLLSATIRPENILNHFETLNTLSDLPTLKEVQPPPEPEEGPSQKILQFPPPPETVS
jgi:HrpA-like RNA helicase